MSLLQRYPGHSQGNFATNTKAFERYVMELLRHMTIQDVAHHLAIGWDTVKEIQRPYFSARYWRPRLKDLDLLAIDEIAIGKGHRYLTVVLDLLSGPLSLSAAAEGPKALFPSGGN